jgi:PAS domain S-box-containing protein
MKTQVEARHESAGRNSDVTEQERILNDLKRSEFYLAEGQRLSHAGSWSFKPDLTCDYWSRELYEILGFDSCNGIPTISDYFTRVHPEDRAVVETTIHGMIAVGEGCDLKKRIIRPDGVQRVIRCVGTPVRENGVVTRFVGTLMDITEQEELTQELRRREASLAEAQRLSHTGSFSWNAVTDELTWSDELYRIKGYDRSVKPTFEVVRNRVHPDDRQLWEDAYKKATQGREVDIEHRVLMPDGSVKFMHVVVYGIQKDGRLVELVGTVRDITERKRAEETIRRSEAYLAEAQRLSHTGSFGWKPDTGEIIWSAETCRIFEYDRAVTPTIGLVAQCVHPEDRADFQLVIERVSQGASNFEHTYRLLMPDGRVKHIHALAHATQDVSGNREFVGAVTDITDQKRAEESLRASEAILAEAQRLSKTGSCAWNVITGEQTWSEEHYRILGYDTSIKPTLELIRDRVHPDDLQVWQQAIARSVEEGRIDFEHRLLMPDGSVKHLHVVADGVQKDGKLVELIGTARDITERKKAEALFTGEKSLHEMIATGVPLKEILNALCLMIEEQHNGMLASVLLLSPDGIHLESLAGPSLPEGWTRQVSSLPIGPCAGSCGTAAYRGSPVIVSDIATDPLWAVPDHRASALSYGLRASWSYPILSSEGKVLGTFCQYYRETRSPNPSDLDLIELAAHLARVAIERREAEEQLRRSEAFLAEGQRLSRTGNWRWNASTGKLTWSQELFRIYGLDPQTTNPSMDLFWERVHPDDRIGLQRDFESAVREKRDLEREFRMVTPDWSIRHFHGVGRAVLNEAGELVEFTGSTVDITERKRAEERAQSHDEAVRLALNAFVKELDVDRFLEHMIMGLTKQFEATSSELWLFDGTTQLASLYVACQRGRVIGAEAVGRRNGIPHVTWQPSSVGRIPKIIELPVQKSLLQNAHFESLKNQGVKTLVLVPLVLGEQSLGFIELHFQVATRLTSDDLDHAQALVHHATLALQLSRLAHRTEQMAVMEERNRMAREIHDTLAQAFAGVVLHSEALGTALGVNKPRSKKALSNIKKLARSGLEEARRSVQALRPRALEGRTLTEALAQEVKRISEDGKHSCEFKQIGEVLKLSAEIQNEFFRIAQEAMTNISKHAQAKSVWITLKFKANQAILTIQDDGIGFAATDSPKPKGGYGLSTMRERALRIGGKLEIESPAGGGTMIRVAVPLDKKLKPTNHST